MHDWTRVDAGIFHHFHHEWISEINRALNRGLLPPDYYAMAEQVAAGFGPDVLTLRDRVATPSSGGTATQTRPQTTYFAESLPGLRARRTSRVVVRHVSGDQIVAMIEIISPGNKSGGAAFRAFVQKACELLDQRIHLLLLDPFPPSARDPDGIHAAIWSEYIGQEFELPPQKPLTFVAYESEDGTRAYIETLAVGDALPEMPLFLAPERYVLVPLEITYQSAWDTVPARWQRVIAANP
jgi:hypothetical protein